MHEEFINQTGVTISYRFYTEKVEPSYRKGDWKDKDEFCAQWVKENKVSICKGSSADIRSLSRDISLMDCIRTEAARSKVEKEAAENKNRELETKVRSLETRIEAMQNQTDRHMKQLEELRASNEEMAGAEIALAAMESEHQKEMNAKDSEIIMLKAMLFDQMMKTA